MTWWQKLVDPRFVVTFALILLFSGAYVGDPDDTMKGALIAGFAGAWGYWLGSSSGTARANDRADAAITIAAASTLSPDTPSGPLGDPVHVLPEDQMK